MNVSEHAHVSGREPMLELRRRVVQPADRHVRVVRVDQSASHAPRDEEGTSEQPRIGLEAHDGGDGHSVRGEQVLDLELPGEIAVGEQCSLPGWGHPHHELIRLFWATVDARRLEQQSPCRQTGPGSGELPDCYRARPWDPVLQPVLEWLSHVATRGALP